MRFDRALKVVEEELKEELQWEVPENFLHYLWVDVIKVEFEELKQWDFKKFKSAVEEELTSRNWNIRDFRNSKNEPISNVFKKLVRMIAKEEGQQLSNDSLSRILNAVRKQYATSGKLVAGIYPPVAFRERRKWNIYEYLGDSDSCFQNEGCNEGNVDWLIQEYELYKRAFFTVFYYKQGNNEGWGRCWVYKVNDNAIYATNFYSKYFEIRSECFKYTIVRLLRKLFDMSENVMFAVGKGAPLPIYLNGDSFVIYEPLAYESSSKVFDAIGELKSKCLWCEDEIEVKELYRYGDPVDYQGRRVRGLIVCGDCEARLDEMVECEECGEFFYREDMVYIDNYGWVCRDCFENEWFYCDECDEPYRRDEAVFTGDGRILCGDCARELGTFCDQCGEFFYYDDDEVHEYSIVLNHSVVRVYLCNECAEEHLRNFQCQQCGKEHYFIDKDFMRSARIRDMVRLGLCPECYSQRLREVYEFSFENKEYASLFADPLTQILAMSD